MPFNSFINQAAKGALPIYEKYKRISEEYEPLALSHKATTTAVQLMLSTKPASSEAKSSPANL